MNNAKIYLASRLSAVQFIRCHGECIEITVKNGEEPQAVFFRSTQFSGKIQARVRGAIFEYSDFKLNNESSLVCDAGFHCISSIFKINGEMQIVDGMIENSTIDADNCTRLEVSSSTMRSSTIERINKNCFFLRNSTFESCSLGAGWNDCTFENVKINLTSIDKSILGKDSSRSLLESIRNIDKNSIASLKANAESMGDSELSDIFFNIKQDKEINEKNEKKSWLIYAIILLVIFFSLPLSGALIDKKYLDNYGFILIFTTLILIILCVSRSKITFFKFLYQYGYSLPRIILFMLLTITGFSLSYLFGNLYIDDKHLYHIDKAKFTLCETIKFSFHQSVSSFFAIGFWDYVKGPEGVMTFYSNIETMLGIISMALIVTTIINNSTSGK